MYNYYVGNCVSKYTSYSEQVKFRNEVSKLITSSKDFRDYKKFLGVDHLYGFPFPINTNCIDIIIRYLIDRKVYITTFDVAQLMMKSLYDLSIPILLTSDKATDIKVGAMMRATLYISESEFNYNKDIEELIDLTLYPGPRTIIDFLKKYGDYITPNDLNHPIVKLFGRYINSKMEEIQTCK